MPIYDFKCRNCKCEFTIPGLTDEEIRETFCVECRGDDLEIIGYNRDGEDLLDVILERLRQLSNEQKTLARKFTKLAREKKARATHSC